MTTLGDNTLERQLSSLFRAEAQGAQLPSGTWQAISPRMGEPDAPSLLRQFMDTLPIPRWDIPFSPRVLAPVASIALAIIVALLFVLLVNDDDDAGPVPAATPTADTQPQATATAIRQSDPVTSWHQFQLPEAVGFNAGVIALADGRILVFGGANGPLGSPDGWVEDPETGFLVQAPDASDGTLSSWILDPESGSTHPTGDLAFIDLSLPWLSQEPIHLLDDGRVMFIAHKADGSEPRQVQFFDPAAQTWTEGVGLDLDGMDQIGVLQTLNGDALVHGGRPTSFQVVVLDVESGSVKRSTPAPVEPHWWGFGHSAMLPDGRFVFMQGQRLAAKETGLFDPNSGEWELIDGPDGSGQYHIIGLENGDVVAVDGDGAVFRLDAVTRRWTAMRALPLEHLVGHPLGLLPSGYSIWAGGPSSAVFIYAHDRDEWLVVENPVPPDPISRRRATLSEDGKLVVVEWNENQAQPTAWILDDPLGAAAPIVTDPETEIPTAITWKRFDLPSDIPDGTRVSPLPDGQLLVFGSLGDFAEEPETGFLLRAHDTRSWILDTNLGRMASTGEMRRALSIGVIRPLDDGRVMVLSGTDLRSTQYFNPDTGMWIAGEGGSKGAPVDLRLRDGVVSVVTDRGEMAIVSAPSFSRFETTNGDIESGHVALLPDGRFMVISESSSARTGIYNPASDTWEEFDGPGDSGSRHWHLVSLPDGSVIAGRDGPNSTFFRFDIAAKSWTEVGPVPAGTSPEGSFAGTPVGILPSGQSIWGFFAFRQFGFTLYDTELDQWLSIDTPCSCDSGTPYVSSDGKLVIVDISGDQREMWVLDDPLAAARAVPQSTAPAATATEATPNPEPTAVSASAGVRDVTVKAAQRFPNQLVSAFDGTSLWFGETRFVVRTDLEGNRTGTFQVARNAITSMTEFDGFLWILDAGEGELRKVSLEGETIDRISVRGDTVQVFAGDGSLWTRSNERLTRHDGDGEVIDQLAIDLSDGQFNIVDGFMWLWKDSKLKQISMSGEELAEWDAPSIPVGESNRADELQVKGEFVWMSGYSRTEITRLNTSTGESTVIELPVRDGEFSSNGVVSTFPAALVLDNSVWVAYMRFSEPDLDPSEQGLFFGETSFRRLSVFDLDGNQLREEVIVQRGEADQYFQLLFMASLAGIDAVNDDVWIAYGAEGQDTLFKVFSPEFLSSGS